MPFLVIPMYMFPAPTWISVSAHRKPMPCHNNKVIKAGQLHPEGLLSRIFASLFIPLHPPGPPASPVPPPPARLGARNYPSISNFQSKCRFSRSHAEFPPAPALKRVGASMRLPITFPLAGPFPESSHLGRELPRIGRSYWPYLNVRGQRRAREIWLKYVCGDILFIFPIARYFL